MKKYILLILLSVVCLQDIYANHTKGGWMYYQYLGPGINDPNKLRYKVGLYFYVECNTSVPETQWYFTIFEGKAPYNVVTNIDVYPSASVQVIGCTTQSCYPCLSNVPPRCYEIRNYETIIELDPSPVGYIVSKQRCCRVININNIQAPSNNFGETYTINIPGSNLGPTAPFDASPQFIFNDTAVVCADNQFSLNFKAEDRDGDSLSYSFVDAYTGGDGTNSSPNQAAAPPYFPIPYANPYTGLQPLGANVTIHPVTGTISGIAPPIGEYVICVLVKEYRDHVYIGETRKELHLKTAFCTPLKANPNFAPVTCDGFTVTFNEQSSGNPTDFLWDFGDPASGAANNTSTQQFPTHTFSAAGIFDVKLVVSAGAGQCIDSITKPISVFPGFFPGFITSPALCVGQPVQFTDTSYTAFGVVDSWRWDFGDGTTLADTSHLKNPAYIYTQPGNYTITLRVTNSKGCDKTISRDITVSDLPVITVFPKDSIYCALDSIQLTATGTGSFSWTPNTNIIGANTATPMVFPSGITKYYATLTNAAGCKNTDSVTVTPKNDLTNDFTGPANICEEDTVTLTGTSNYAPNVTWQWSPAATVESPTNGTTRAYPSINTSYTLQTRWGKHCIANTTKAITVKPLAIANAGPSPALCGNQPSAQLHASGGNTYTWSPATGLSDPTIPDPIASPTVTTIYTVAVGVAGCPKTREDSLIVYVQPLPQLNLINDTLICNIDTLQLTTTGAAGNYTWSPNYMISNTSAQSPLVSPDVPTKYFVSLTDAFGCRSTDSVFVDVKDHVSLFAGKDTTICRTDGFFLGTVSDALHYKWTPAMYLSSDTVKHPFVVPLTTTTYRLIANIGKCQSQDDIEIKVAPYPAANAGLDTSICPGASTQLTASGGSSYLWTPATFLSNRNIANPNVIQPTATIRYIVAVTDTLGCPKPVKDTVWVIVYPKVVANAGPRDTNVVIGEPVLLHATGGASYLWDPATWLNNPLISNPVSLPQDNITYVVTATSAVGNCVGTDTISLHLFKVVPDIYVPTAFTPNGDGNNDILRPILLGMKELRYFKVYNRFGNLLYSTSDIGKGWDGIYGGKKQDPATYVWMAEGITFKGEVRFKQGYAVLIRE